METSYRTNSLLAVCVLLVLSCASTEGQRLNSKQWLHKHCKAYQEDYAPLIHSYLSRYSYGIKVNDILSLTTPPGRSVSVVGDIRPVIYLVNNTLHYVDDKLAHLEARGGFSAGFSVYFSPVIKRLLNEVALPDMPIAFNPDDWPSNDEEVGGGPYFGYCNTPKLTSNLPFPDLWSVEAFSCGQGCTPFTESDHRQEQAIFLGRPTGWHKGTRRAVIEAGRKHPDFLYSGLTEYPDPGIVSDKDEKAFGTVSQQPVRRQIQEHKYIVNVDGWCGSKRMKQLLASDSAILNVVSMESEWYTPLLVPMKHYIPVRFEANDPDLDEGSDLISKIRWAQEHPEEVGRIVQHAKNFHGFYLSQRGEECYAVQLLEEYSRLLLDSWKLQDMNSGLSASR